MYNTLPLNATAGIKNRSSDFGVGAVVELPDDLLAEWPEAELGRAMLEEPGTNYQVPVSRIRPCSSHRELRCIVKLVARNTAKFTGS